MLGTEAEQKDLREVIKAGIKSGQEVGGYLMRYTFWTKQCCRKKTN